MSSTSAKAELTPQEAPEPEKGLSPELALQREIEAYDVMTLVNCLGLYSLRRVDFWLDYDTNHPSHKGALSCLAFLIAYPRLLVLEADRRIASPESYTPEEIQTYKEALRVSGLPLQEYRQKKNR